MAGAFLKIYDFFRSRRTVAMTLLGLLTLLMTAMVLRLGYKEDISDFLPLESGEATAMRAFRHYSGANRIVVAFEAADSTPAGCDAVTAAIDDFATCLAETDTARVVRDFVCRVSLDETAERATEIFRYIPYFLDEADYRRMDSLLARPGFVSSSIESARQQLMMPASALTDVTVGNDPLGLFLPVIARMGDDAPAAAYEQYDGYIFSPDMRLGLATLSSPYGSSETQQNARLLKMLNSVADSVSAENPGVDIRFLGGPVVAVENARQIRSDSVLSISLAMVLILALLLYVFRTFRTLFLITVGVVWGWLFALCGLSLIHSDVSVIVIGISSVIVGIAVNYPLHVIAHTGHHGNRREALREIVTPLLVGNVTTVGAFLTLVPLDSVALRDLGIFAALLLVGTIIFSLLWLPHLTSGKKLREPRVLGFLSNLKPETNRWFVAIIFVLTAVAAYLSKDVCFDADMTHINFMTPQQRTDMEYFSRMHSGADSLRQVFVVSQGVDTDRALAVSDSLQSHIATLKKGVVKRAAGRAGFIVSSEEQCRRLARWRRFADEHRTRLIEDLDREANSAGFTPDAFRDFRSIFAREYDVITADSLCVVTSHIYDRYIARGEVTDVLYVEPEDAEKVEEMFAGDNTAAFDVSRLGSSLTRHLSDNFNFIGWACGFIVFLFLWMSMGSLELAVISFIPMAVSWLWILGLMSVLGISFNIVNIILATFIFGQGDDYTIFMTEGASYEYTWRRRVLASYRSSIIVSALIMFIGIGTLIFAKHPALRSLAEVTIVGMFSVVIMAYTLPVFFFRRLVSDSDGAIRRRPIRILPLLRYILFKSLPQSWRLSAVSHLVGIRIRMTSPIEIPQGCRVYCPCMSRIDEMILRIVVPGAELTSDPDADIRAGVPVVGLFILGSEDLAPLDSPVLCSGEIVVHAGNPILNGDFCRYYEETRRRLTPLLLGAAHFAPLVIDRYRYKENDIFRQVRRSMSVVTRESLAVACEGDIDIVDTGYGQKALLLALLHPDRTVNVSFAEPSNAEVLRICAEGIAPNIRIKEQN